MRLMHAAAIAALLSAGVLAGPAVAQDYGRYDQQAYANSPPPPLPSYYQPPCPGYGFIWTPGYWAWDGDQEDYFWVPGTWVRPPRIGYLWTPGYWAYRGSYYSFNAGYWSDRIGYYGGINYGYGYNGYGYDGGYWQGREFFYNRRANNIRDRWNHNLYDREIHEGRRGDRTSFNGGRGGVLTRSDPREPGGRFDERFGPTTLQREHSQMAERDMRMHAGANHGAPPVAATSQVGVMTGPGAVPARGADPRFQGYAGGGPRGFGAGPAGRNFDPGQSSQPRGPMGFAGQPARQGFGQPQQAQPRQSQPPPAPMHQSQMQQGQTPPNRSSAPRFAPSPQGQQGPQRGDSHGDHDRR